MKKIIIAIALMFGSVSLLQAQTPTTVTKETKKEKKEKTSVQNNGLKKDGTPDMRLKANKTKVQTTTTVQPTTNPQTQVTTQPKPRKQVQVQQPQTVQPQVTQQRTQVSTSTTKSTDQAVGTDAKGRTIYRGPKGGKYYINKNGNKEYVK